MAAQDAAYASQGNQAQIGEQARQTLGATGKPQGILSWMTQMPARITSDMVDSAVHAADSMAHDGSWGEAATRVGRDVAAGAASTAVNTGDALEGLARNGIRDAYTGITHPQQAALEAEDPAMRARDQQMDGSAQRSPIWDHARGAILDFRDAVAVKDPNLVDGLTQSVAQLAIPFAGYSKALSGLHDAAIAAQGLEDISATQGFGSYLMKTAQKDLTGFATKIAAPGAVTDATALQPHAMRFADMITLGRHTEGKLGAALRVMDPSGGLLDHYISYLTDRADESAAEGRWKNVLDGFGVNMIATPLLTSAASVLKQGTRGLRYLIDNGVASGADFPRPPAATQAGKIVFHGTPHDFDEFDSSKIGTGEGNQTFGHGLYFAENPEVAGSYARGRVNNRLSKEDLSAYYSPGAVRETGGGLKDKIISYDQQGGYVHAERTDPAFGRKPYPVTYGDMGADWVNVRRALGQPLQLSGKVHTVDIPDSIVGKTMHWDKDIGEQPALQRAVQDLDARVVPERDRFRVMLGGEPVGPTYLTRDAALAETNLLRGERPHETGGMLYKQLAEVLGSQKDASEYLQRKGITGIKFLDQGSRGAGEGTHNIVLFDAKHAKIVKKGK
jgi:hypothetical protein